MSRRSKSDRQTAMPFDMRTRPPPEPPTIDMRTRELNSFVGLYRGKNLYVELCDICHDPAVKLGDRFYHRQPCDSPCGRATAPYPAASALRRVRAWYAWAEQKAKGSGAASESERHAALERLVHPMQPYLVQQIVRADRRNLPSVLECRLIYEAMCRTGMEHDILPVEFEEWKTRSPDA